MSCECKANLQRMNEDSGSSQVTRPSLRSKQQAEILQQGAPETSKFICNSNKPLTDCCTLQYSSKVSPIMDSAPVWLVMREPGMTQQHVITFRVIMNKNHICIRVYRK